MVTNGYTLVLKGGNVALKVSIKVVLLGLTSLCLSNFLIFFHFYFFWNHS